MATIYPTTGYPFDRLNYVQTSGTIPSIATGGYIPSGTIAVYKDAYKSIFSEVTGMPSRQQIIDALAELFPDYVDEFDTKEQFAAGIVARATAQKTKRQGKSVDHILGL